MNKSLKKVVLQEPVVERREGFVIVREDMVPGGSKLRFLPFICPPKKELVYASPFCGGAALALSEMGKRSNQKVTIFYAKRRPETRHARQTKVAENGGKIVWVPNGYFNVLVARGREYAAKRDAHFLEPGFDVPEAEEPFVEFMRKVRKKVGDPPEIWCATGSGMLARCLGIAFPDSKVTGVVVGLRSKNEAQKLTDNVTLVDSGYKFGQPCKTSAPFESCAFYDSKAWERMVKEGKKGAMLWNVL